MDRETKLTETFVELADTLVDHYEIAGFLHRLTDRCAELVDAAAVGVLLTDVGGELRLAGASTGDMRALELFEIQKREGPCFDAYTVGKQIREDNLERAHGRWPHFIPRALQLGYKSVHAFPLRLRRQTLGALNVFFDRTGPFSDTNVLALQALADVATIGILQQRNLQKAVDVTEQLQTALDSRVVIERAVGILMERLRVSTDTAFELMRKYARDTNQHVRAVALSIVTDVVPAQTVEERSTD